VKFLSLTLLLSPLLLATPAAAQRVRTVPNTGDTVTVGAGALVMPSYEGSDDYDVTAAPGARGRIDGFNFVWRGNRFWADVIRDQDGGPGWDFQLGPVFNLNFNRTSGIKDEQVRALCKRKLALEVGGYVGIGKQGLITSDYDKLSVGVAYVHDVTDIHDSYVWTPSIDYGTPLSRRTYVGISVAADYAGGGYARTYFAVTPEGSAASGLPVFTPRAGWKDWSTTLLFSQSITGDLTHGLSFVAGGSYRRMLNDFAESPVTSIAGSRDQWYGGAGLAYTF